MANQNEYDMEQLLEGRVFLGVSIEYGYRAGGEYKNQPVVVFLQPSEFQVTVVLPSQKIKQ